MKFCAKFLKIMLTAVSLLSLPYAGAAEESINVTFAGDYGETENTVSTLTRINLLAPQLHFALGDLSYSKLPNREGEWCQLVRSHVSAPFLLVPGNHESDGQNGHIDEFSKCLPYSYSTPLNGIYPEQYYIDSAAVNPLARFIMISPGIKFSSNRHVFYGRRNENMQWLEAAIDGAKKAGIPWVIVGMHKVCMSTEAKPCEIGPELTNMLIKKGVDVVLGGHVHAYERTHQLSCAKAGEFEPSCIRNAQNDFVKGDGTVFVTVGTGGTPLRRINKNDSEMPYFAKTLGADDGAHYGPVILNITPGRISQQFVDAKTGEILDNFSIKDLVSYQ